MATHKSSQGDKQAVLVKIVKQLKRVYGSVPKPINLPVFETLLYGICLEDVDFDRARKAFDRLRSSFLDWNEVRVTTVTELDHILEHLPESAVRAVRLRQLLMHIYDHQYSFDIDSLKKRTQDLVQRQLVRIKHLTPFARNYVTQASLGAHVIPLDRRMLLTAVWLGLVPVGVHEDEAGDLLKSLVRKADGAEFFYLLKSFSTSSKASRQITEESVAKAGDGFDVSTAPSRLAEMLPTEKPVSHEPAKVVSASRSKASSSAPEAKSTGKSGVATKKVDGHSGHTTAVRKSGKDDSKSAASTVKKRGH